MQEGQEVVMILAEIARTMVASLQEKMKQQALDQVAAAELKRRAEMAEALAKDVQEHQIGSDPSQFQPEDPAQTLDLIRRTQELLEQDPQLKEKFAAEQARLHQVQGVPEAQVQAPAPALAQVAAAASVEKVPAAPQPTKRTPEGSLAAEPGKAEREASEKAFREALAKASAITGKEAREDNLAAYKQRQDVVNQLKGSMTELEGRESRLNVAEATLKWRDLAQQRVDQLRRTGPKAELPDAMRTLARAERALREIDPRGPAAYAALDKAQAERAKFRTWLKPLRWCLDNDFRRGLSQANADLTAARRMVKELPSPTAGGLEVEKAALAAERAKLQSAQQQIAVISKEMTVIRDLLHRYEVLAQRDWQHLLARDRDNGLGLNVLRERGVSAPSISLLAALQMQKGGMLGLTELGMERQAMSQELDGLVREHRACVARIDQVLKLQTDIWAYTRALTIKERLENEAGGVVSLVYKANRDELKAANLVVRELGPKLQPLGIHKDFNVNTELFSLVDKRDALQERMDDLGPRLTNITKLHQELFGVERALQREADHGRGPGGPQTPDPTGKVVSLQKTR